MELPLPRPSEGANPQKKMGRPPLQGVEHGTTTMYASRGCRCEPCRAANAAYRKARRARLSDERQAGREVAHGIGGTYREYGCRCPDCRAAATRESYSYRQRASGRVEAGPESLPPDASERAVQPAAWAHPAAHDYSPFTGAVASCAACGWGEAFSTANLARLAAEAHRSKFGRAAL